MIEPEPLQQVQRTYVRHRGKNFTYFAGCDYFRMASHPAVLQAVQIGLKKYGLNVAASRMTTGNHALYGMLEKCLTEFFDVPSALVISNGYMSNSVAAQALCGQFSHVLLDEKAHPSLQDASRFLDCPVLKFQHQDASDLARGLARCGPGAKPILLTDGMNSSTGHIAPLADYLKILPRDGLILLDDAHGAGTLGKTGQGTPELTGVSRQRIVQTITLSKAFGVYGGAILGTAALRKRILERSPMFVGHTPLPLPLANAAITSIGILRRDRRLRQRLEENVRRAKSVLLAAKFPVTNSPAPIVPFQPANARDVTRLKEKLRARQIFSSLIRYPGGPPNGYFRFVLSSEHTRKQVDALVGALLEMGH